MKIIHLQARSLASKFGFMDGDIVSLFCEENNIESELKDKDSHDVFDQTSKEAPSAFGKSRQGI